MSGGPLTRRNGRRVALAAGAVTCAAFIAASLQWRQLAVRWYTARLESERELLLDLGTAASDSPAYEAVRLFVKTPQGKQRLLEAYLEAVSASGQDFTRRLERVRTYTDGAWLLLWLQGNEMHDMGYWNIPNWSFRGMGGGGSVERRLHRGRPLLPILSMLQALIVEVGYDRYPMPGDSNLSFSVVQRREGEERILGSPMDWKRWTEGRVALIESVHRQWQRDGCEDEGEVIFRAASRP
jgi:hypothetical protein